MRQLMNFVKANIGDSGFAVLISSILIISGLAFLVFIIRKAVGIRQILVLVGIVAVGLALISRIEIAEEKIHLLEFALLGWLALRDTFTPLEKATDKERSSLTGFRINKSLKGFSLALAFTLAIGILDEGFQAILPYRYFQGWDILLNSLGGVWGVILFLVFKVNR